MFAAQVHSGALRTGAALQGSALREALPWVGCQAADRLGGGRSLWISAWTGGAAEVCCCPCLTQSQSRQIYQRSYTALVIAAQILCGSLDNSVHVGILPAEPLWSIIPVHFPTQTSPKSLPTKAAEHAAREQQFSGAKDDGGAVMQHVDAV